MRPASFVERHYPPRQAKEWDKTNTYPHLLLKAMAEIGWFGLAFPAEAGGDGGGPSSWPSSPSSWAGPASISPCASSGR